MSSSTSSSEGAPTQRKIFLRIILTILIGMGVAMGIIRGFSEAMGANAQELLGRVIEARDGLVRILDEDPKELVMVFGSSMVEAGFGPREFDQYVAEMGGDVSSWNYGFGGLNPMFQEILARRLVDELNAKDRQLKLLLIEFNPFQTTKTRRNRAAAIEEPYLSLLASPGEIWDRILEDPESGLRIAEIRYLRDGVSAEATTTYFLAEPFTEDGPSTEPDIEEPEDIDARISEIGEAYFPKWREEFPDYVDCDWCYGWKGGNALDEERSEELRNLLAEYYTLIQHDYYMARDRLRRINTADIELLDFDEDLVVAFINMVKALDSVAEHTEIILLPKNTNWITHPPEVLDRQRRLLERIERETGVVVRNFQQIDAVSNDMFSDTTHLNAQEGLRAFSRFLAEEYASLLR